MPIGVQPSWAVINANSTAIVLQARAALDAINYHNTYLQNLGQAGLTASATAAGDSTASADAAELLSIFQNLAAIATVAAGGPYTGPSLPFNFVEQTIPLWNNS